MTFDELNALSTVRREGALRAISRALSVDEEMMGICGHPVSAFWAGAGAQLWAKSAGAVARWDSRGCHPRHRGRYLVAPQGMLCDSSVELLQIFLLLGSVLVCRRFGVPHSLRGLRRLPQSCRCLANDRRGILCWP